MELKLKAERRDGAGKGVAHKLRAAGRVPGVVYGHGFDPVSVSVDAKELSHALHTSAGANVLLDLSIGKDRLLTMPRQVQRDHVRGTFLHVDFLRLSRDEQIEVEVPVVLVGQARGVKEGGVIEHHLWNVAVQCLPHDVPAGIEADVTEMVMNDVLKVADLKAPPGCTILSPPDEAVVSIVAPQVLRVPEAEEAEAAAAEGEAPEEGAEAGTGAGAAGAEPTPDQG